MSNSRFEPQTFFRNPEFLAARIAADDLFGFLRRSLDLPSSWTALVTRRSGDRQVYRGGSIDGADADDVLLARTGAVEMQWIENDVTSSDGFRFRFEISARVALLAEQGDLHSFQTQLLGHQRLATRADLVGHLQPTVRKAVAVLADARTAEFLFDASSRQEVENALRTELEGACFAAGIALESGPHVRLDSPAFRQVVQARELSTRRAREVEAQQPLREARAEAQRQHMDHLSSILARLKQLSGDDASVSVPELIRTFSEKERAALYHSLFAANEPTARTRWIVLAAGDQLLFFEGASFHEPARRLRIAGSAGPMRSVQTARPGGAGDLLIGGATGVYRLPLERAEPDLAYLAPNPPPVRGGFNSAVEVGGSVFAAHSELGLWRWSTNEDGPGEPILAPCTRGAKAVRNLTVWGDDVYCAVDRRVVRWPASGSATTGHLYEGAVGTITAICPSAEGLFAGTSEGEIWRWDAEEERPERIYRGAGRAIESLALLAAHGIGRLFFADTSICAQAMVLGDSYTCRYEAGGQTIRRIDVAEDVIVATNEPRDRLIVWSMARPDRPCAVVPIGAMIQRSIQDVCLIPSSTG